MKTKISLETDIQKAILDYFALKGYLVLRLRNQPIFNVKSGKFWKNPNNIPGVADLFVVDKNHFIEVKRPGQKPRSDQVDFGRAAIKAHSNYSVVHSLDEVIALGL